jgi:hypothetical protein
VSGSTITVKAKIDGDLLAAGGTIKITEAVTGDVLTGGGTLIIDGKIGDDLRAVGGTIQVEKDVMGDVVVAGGNVEISPGTIVFGDLIVTSGKTTINGIVKGNAKLIGGDLYINGTIEKNLDVKGGTLFVNGIVFGESTLAAEQISILNRALFHQNVKYWQKNGEINFGDSLSSATASFQPQLALDVNDSNWYFLGYGSLVFVLFYLATALLLLFLFQHLFSAQLQQAASILDQQSVKALGYGILYLIGVPFIAILLLITVIGIPIGLFGLVMYIFTLAVAHIISSLVVAGWYNYKYHKNWNKNTLVWIAFAAFLLIKLLTIFPFFGWILSVLLVGISFGAIIDNLRQKKVHAIA